MVITSYIPAEKFSRAVEHPCQFWIGTIPFRLSIFGRRQHLWANGWRTSTSQPGHHQTAIQTLGLPKPDLIVLDALRRQRNVNDYEGDPIADATLHACLQAADKLLGHTLRWLQAQHPEWGLV